MASVLGPTPRDYTQKTPKKMKAAALRGALSDRAREGRVHVVSAFVDGDAPKTKAALATLNAVTQAKRVLVVLDRDDVLNWVSLRNAPQVHLIEAGQLNTYDVLVADEVVFTETALAEYVAGPAKGKGRGVEKPDLATPRRSRAASRRSHPPRARAPSRPRPPPRRRRRRPPPRRLRRRRPLPTTAPAKKAAAKKAPAKKAADAAEAAADETTEEKA